LAPGERGLLNNLEELASQYGTPSEKYSRPALDQLLKNPTFAAYATRFLRTYSTHYEDKNFIPGVQQDTSAEYAKHIWSSLNIAPNLPTDYKPDQGADMAAYEQYKVDQATFVADRKAMNDRANKQTALRRQQDAAQAEKNNERQQKIAKHANNPYKPERPISY